MLNAGIQRSRMKDKLDEGVDAEREKLIQTAEEVHIESCRGLAADSAAACRVTRIWRARSCLCSFALSPAYCDTTVVCFSLPQLTA